MSLEVEVAGGAWLSFTSLRHDGAELLADPDALPPTYRVHGARAGITLLHPWANRLRTRAAGVPADRNGQPIHGLPGTWDVGEGVASSTFTVHELFPWPHEAEVRWSVDGDALHVVTKLRSSSSQPVPLAFGWHPYFTLPDTPRAEWMLELPARRRLELDPLGLPTGAACDELPERAPLAGRAFDHGYEGGSVWAVEGRSCRIEVVHDEGFPAAQVFAPPDADVVAFEPMAAVTDALSSGRGLRHATHARAAFTVRITAGTLAA